jgi:hypothetical protein
VPGFVLHVAFEDSQGFCVAEIWETKGSTTATSTRKVVPNVPAEIKQEVINLHNVYHAVTAPFHPDTWQRKPAPSCLPSVRRGGRPRASSSPDREKRR